MICKPDGHSFVTIACLEKGDVAGHVAIEWCEKCGVIHENIYSDAGTFVAPYCSHVPVGVAGMVHNPVTGNDYPVVPRRSSDG